jgi:N-hydroxyarylamine O-acetyltransferase
MPLTSKQLELYFSRIGYQGLTQVSEETLDNIHTAQIFSIPFENLELQEIKNANKADTIIHLDEKSIFNKLVLNRRGGYCHENNELLATVLSTLGFKVDRLAARVLIEPNLSITHKLLLVTIGDKQWIADVGFGANGIYKPMPLVPDQIIKQYGDFFRLIREEDKYTLEITQAENWVKLYEFSTNPVNAVDFEPMSYYVSHHPNSIFVKNRICVLPTPEGRITLNNDQLKIKQGKSKTQISLKDGPGYLEALETYFGLKFPKETQFKAFTTRSTDAWCSLFRKAAVGIGLLSTLFIAKQVQQRWR